MEPKELAKEESLILSLLKQAGLYLENKFYSFKNVYDKDTSFVMENFAKTAEEIIASGIAKQFPGHQLVSAKKPDYHLLKSDADLWIVSALDGFNHFSRNIPIYTTNLAFQRQGEIVLSGVNYQPAKQLYVAQKGRGAKLNGLPIQVSRVGSLKQAYVFVELPETDDGFEMKMNQVKELIKACKQVETFRIGALAQCLVASGSFDAYVDFSGTSTVYGQAASRLIIEEAGGQVFNLSEPKEESISLAATNGKRKEELDKIINLNV